mgnify:CR=1 FL=1
MHLQGTQYIQDASLERYFQAKLVFNENGAIFFPVTAEHRDQSGPGIHYADNYKGNALAAMISPGKIEIRYHQDFTDDQVRELLNMILRFEQVSFLNDYEATYQGRPI